MAVSSALSHSKTLKLIKILTASFLSCIFHFYVACTEDDTSVLNLLVPSASFSMQNMFQPHPAMEKKVAFVSITSSKGALNGLVVYLSTVAILQEPTPLSGGKITV